SSMLTGVAVAALVVVGGYGLYAMGKQQGLKSASASGAAPANAVPAAGRKVLYWHDPMVPGQKFDKPGKSPFMDMQLVPVYADTGSAGGGVKVDSTLQQ